MRLWIALWVAWTCAQQMSTTPLKPIGKVAAASRLAKGKANGKGKAVASLQNTTNVTVVVDTGALAVNITPIARPSIPNEIRLYPQTTPDTANEQWDNYMDSRIVRNVVDPTITTFLPTAANRTGTAVIIAPGGAFVYLDMDGEFKTAQKLADIGISAFVLKYRTTPSSRDPSQFLTDMYKDLYALAAANAAGLNPNVPTPSEAVSDGKAAVQLVRNRAKEWGIDPTRVGFMGTSAGAMTTLEVGLGVDPATRPDFLGNVIGPKTIANVPNYAPPLFVASCVDDPLFPGTSENIVSAWSRAKRPIEAHFFERGGHGLPAGTTGDAWLNMFSRWLGMRGYLSPNSTSTR